MRRLSLALYLAAIISATYAAKDDPMLWVAVACWCLALLVTEQN